MNVPGTRKTSTEDGTRDCWDDRRTPALTAPSEALESPVQAYTYDADRRGIPIGYGDGGWRYQVASFLDSDDGELSTERSHADGDGKLSTERSHAGGDGELSTERCLDGAKLPPERPPGGDLARLDRVMLNLEVSRRTIRFLTGSLAAAIVVIAFLSAGVVYFIMADRERYFALSEDATRVVELKQAEEPPPNQQALLNWMADTVIRSLSLDFLNWRRQLNDVRNEFDPDGFASFVRSLSDGGHITKIERQRLNLSAVMESAPVLIGRAADKGRPVWKAELPVLVSFQSSEGIISNQRLRAEITAMTVPRSQNVRGAVIRQIVFSKAD